MKRRVSLAAVFAAACFGLMPSTTLAYTSTGTSYPLIVIDNGPGAQQDPRVGGRYASYSDDGQGGTTAAIEYFDFSTQATVVVPKVPDSFDFLSDVSGDTVVFSRLSISPAGSRIYS